MRGLECEMEAVLVTCRYGCELLLHNSVRMEAQRKWQEDRKRFGRKAKMDTLLTIVILSLKPFNSVWAERRWRDCFQLSVMLRYHESARIRCICQMVATDESAV